MQLKVAGLFKSVELLLTTGIKGLNRLIRLYSPGKYQKTNGGKETN